MGPDFRFELSIVPCRAWVRRVVTLATTLWCAAAFPCPIPQLFSWSEADVAPYRNAKSFAERTLPDLVGAIPELKGIEAPPSPEKGVEALTVILPRVGENVKEFVEKFPDTTSLEEITMERLRPNGSIEAGYNQSFRYLVVSHHDYETMALEEFRTDLKGEAVEPSGLAEGFMITKGFASAAIHFHPSRRSDSLFRYLGKQIVDGKTTEVVAFGQRPGWAVVTGRLEARGKSALILLQGLVWIDPASYQIIRMRTDLLAPRTDVGLKSETTEIAYGAFHFPEMPRVLCLPREVTVTSEWDSEVKVKAPHSASSARTAAMLTSDWNGKTYRNKHRYSDYKLFRATSKLTF